MAVNSRVRINFGTINSIHVKPMSPFNSVQYTLLQEPVRFTIDNIYYATGIRNSNLTNETMRVISINVILSHYLITTNITPT